MRIYDPKTKRTLTQVTLFLTPEEALELADSAADLARTPEKHHHHVSDSEFAREIVIAVHTPQNLQQFDAESRAIIEGKEANQTPEPMRAKGPHGSS